MPKISVSAGFCIFHAVMLILLPLQWCAAWLTAMAVHEMGHCIALRMTKRPIERIHLTVTGAQIQTTSLSGGEDLLCSLAGPVAGLLLALVTTGHPRLFLCALWQSVYNLLPLDAMDGGRALYQCARLCFSEKIAARICNIFHYGTLGCIFVIGLLAAFCGSLGILPLLIAIIILLRNRKTPCNAYQ